MKAALIIAGALALTACGHQKHASVDPLDTWRLPQTAAGRADARAARAGVEGVCGPIATDQIRGRIGTSPADYQCRTKATELLERNKQ